MVCLGNICRSPLAEGILAKKCKNMNVIVDSAGTSAYHSGHSPDVRSKYIASSNGICIKDQRARQINKSDIQSFDLIFAMDRENLKNIKLLAQTEVEKKKIILIRNIDGINANLDVPDPYFGGKEGFQEVYNMLDKSCEEIKMLLKKELNV